MMTQSVMTQAANLFGNAAQSVTSKGKQPASGFDQIINSNMKSTQSTSDNTDNTTTRKASLKNTDDSSKSDVQSDVTKQTEKAAAKDVKTEVVTKTQTGKTQDAITAKEDNTQTEEPELEGQVLSEIASMLQTIQQVVMNTLNISSEELDQLLTDQGMTMTDLLQSESLQQLVLANNGTSDILTVLTDETLADTLKGLIQTVDTIKSDANLGMTDAQMKAMLDEALLQNEAQVGSTDINAVIESLASNKGMVDQKQDISGKSKTEQTEGDTKVQTQDQKNTSAEAGKVSETQESSAKTQSDTKQEESLDLKAQDQFQNFIDNMVKSTTQNEVQFDGTITQVTQLRDIANQILERIKVTVTTDQTSMELQLNPENLGKVNLSIQSKDGVMTAQFIVQNEISKEAIESQLSTLKETLNQQGIKVEAIEVTVATYSFEQQNQENNDQQTDSKNNRSGKQISMEDALNMMETPQEMDATQDIIGRGGQIDYTA